MPNPLNLNTFVPPEYKQLSTTEKAIGVNSVGKTIYERVFTGTSGGQVEPGAIDGSTLITTFTNEVLLDAYGYINWSAGSSSGVVALPYAANADSYAIISVFNDRQVYLTIRNTNLINQSYTVILVYYR